MCVGEFVFVYSSLNLIGHETHSGALTSDVPRALGRGGRGAGACFLGTDAYYDAHMHTADSRTQRKNAVLYF